MSHSDIISLVKLLFELMIFFYRIKICEFGFLLVYNLCCSISNEFKFHLFYFVLGLFKWAKSDIFEVIFGMCCNYTYHMYATCYIIYKVVIFISYISVIYKWNFYWMNISEILSTLTIVGAGTPEQTDPPTPTASGIAH